MISGANSNSLPHNLFSRGLMHTAGYNHQDVGYLGLTYMYFTEKTYKLSL